MKCIIKSFGLLLAAMTILFLAGCVNSPSGNTNPTEQTAMEPTEAITEAPTEAPSAAPTADPTAELCPTPMPTEVPVMPEQVGDGDFFTLIRCNQPMIVDMDGDGEDDIVLITSEFEKEWYRASYCTYVVSITRASDPEHPYVYETVSGFYGILGCIADCDPSDAAKELIFTFDEDDNCYLTYAFRLKDDGSDFESFSEPILFMYEAPFFHGLPDDFVYHADEGFHVEKGTIILGTHTVSNRVTITEDGFTLLNDEYLYEYEWKLSLTRDLELVMDNGSKVTVKQGSEIIPYSTDRETFVKVRLADGSIGRAEVTFGDEDIAFPVYINGVQQDEYAYLPYAG